MNRAQRDRLWRVGFRLAYRVQRVVWFLFRPRITGSYVAVWHAGRLLVIRNSYLTILSLPAGRLKRGERPVDGAVRELCEEVGIAVAPDALRYVDEIVYRGLYAEDHAHFFELECGEAPAFEVDGREVVWAGFLSPDEALERGVVAVVRRYLTEMR